MNSKALQSSCEPRNLHHTHSEQILHTLARAFIRLPCPRDTCPWIELAAHALGAHIIHCVFARGAGSQPARAPSLNGATLGRIVPFVRERWTGSVIAAVRVGSIVHAILALTISPRLNFHSLRTRFPRAAASIVAVVLACTAPLSGVPLAVAWIFLRRSIS
jgi:hypothetical protein